MHVQVINFHLRDLSEADFRTMCDEVAPAFGEVPGMISKVWLANPRTNTYGGVYTWTNREAMEEFGRSDLFNAVATNPNFTDITATDFDVLEGPTSVTHGFPAVRADIT